MWHRQHRKRNHSRFASNCSGYRDLVVEARTQDQWGQACVVQQHWLVDTADWFAAETAVIVAVGLAELAEPTAILQLACVNLVFDIGPSNGILLITHSRLQGRAILGRSLIQSYTLQTATPGNPRPKLDPKLQTITT